MEVSTERDEATGTCKIAEKEPKPNIKPSLQPLAGTSNGGEVPDVDKIDSPGSCTPTATLDPMSALAATFQVQGERVEYAESVVADTSPGPQPGSLRVNNTANGASDDAPTAGGSMSYEELESRYAGALEQITSLEEELSVVTHKVALHLYEQRNTIPTLNPNPNPNHNHNHNHNSVILSDANMPMQTPNGTLNPITMIEKLSGPAVI